MKTESIQHAKGSIYIGTSGWSYKHWKETFYPIAIKDQEHFNYYATQFSTVEINNSFYRLPPATTFSAWKKQAPDNFIFAVKASRYFTHMKKLNVDADSIRNFFRQAGKLKEKMGPVLFQLPPKWAMNTARLETFIKALPKKLRFTFEFRDHSWYQPEIYQVLQRYNCAFCIYELDHHFSPLEVTADFVYVRLHGPGAKYQGSYSEAVLQAWAERSTQWQQQGKDVYIYFDNDQAGYAALNAKQLQELLK